MSEGPQIIPWAPPGTKESPFANDNPDGQPRSSPPPLIQSSADFTRDFAPPDYLIDGILQRRFCYSLTATTGTGKTAIMLRISAHAALGRAIGSLQVEQGKVLYFAGENPDDIRMRWIGLSSEMGFNEKEAEVYFIPGTFKISAFRTRIAEEMSHIGEFSLIVIDTSAAYFEGEEENSNSQMGAHARRLRSLCEMPGGPCVLIACHPVKNAGEDNLLPRGGGAFLAEVDGNLTARKADSAVAVHWQGKFRGPEFSEILFGLRTITNPRLKDSRGRLIPTVISSPMGDNAREEMVAVARTQEDQLLLKLSDTPSASLSDLAISLGWNLQSGEPYKMKVSRTIDKLEAAKLIKRDRDGITLTPAGEKAVEKLTPTKPKQED
jgi:AAA domain